VIDRVEQGEPLRVWERPARPGAQAVRVALIHGFEENWDSWQPLAQLLSPDLHLYALDLPWRANSVHDWANRGTSSIWLERALALLPVRPDLVMAHSFGASNLLELLAVRPETVRAPAVLVAPVYRPHDSAMSPLFFGEAVQRFRSVLEEGMRVQLGARALSLPPAVLKTMARKVRERVEPQGFLQFYNTITRAGTLPLHRIDVPVLVVGGTLDPSMPAAALRSLADQVADLTVDQDPALSHFCQLEQPTRVAAAVSRFLAEQVPQDGRPLTYASEAMNT
jgi:pimeloyl-ACP methyl ester carboxylesterase